MKEKEIKDRLLVLEIASSLMAKGEAEKAKGVLKIYQEETEVDMGWYFDEFQDYSENELPD